MFSEAENTGMPSHTHDTQCLLPPAVQLKTEKESTASKAFKSFDFTSAPLSAACFQVRGIGFSLVSFQVLMKCSTKHSFQWERHCRCRKDNSWKSSQNPNMQLQTQLFGFSALNVHTKSTIGSLYCNFLMKKRSANAPHR